MNDAQPFTPPPQAAAGQRRKKFLWRLIFSIFAVPFLLLCLATFLFRVGYTIRENSGRQAMNVELEKLVSEGLPVDDKSIEELYGSRTSNEHVEDWLRLLATIESPDMNDAFAGIPLLDRTVDDELAYRQSYARDWMYAQVCTAFSDKQQELISRIRQLAEEPTPTHFPIYWESLETRLPEVQNTRQVARILYVDAHVGLHNRESGRVVKDVVSLYSLTRQVDAVPCCVSRLTGMAIRRMGLEILQRSIEVDLLKDEELHQLDQLLQGYSEIGDRYRAMIGEELGIDLPVYTNPTIAMKSKKPIPARGYDAVYFISLMRRAMQLETEPWSEFYDSTLALEAELAAENGFLPKADHMLTHLLLPSLSGLAASCINEAQWHRLARLAIAVRLHAHQSQSLPVTLDALPGQDQTLHPMGTEPFGYKTTKDGSILWGFELNKQVRQTPDSPVGSPSMLPGDATGEPETALWIWPIMSNVK